jgi:hypothetical protein
MASGALQNSGSKEEFPPCIIVEDPSLALSMEDPSLCQKTPAETHPEACKFNTTLLDDIPGCIVEEVPWPDDETCSCLGAQAFVEGSKGATAAVEQMAFNGSSEATMEGGAACMAQSLRTNTWLSCLTFVGTCRIWNIGLSSWANAWICSLMRYPMCLSSGDVPFVHKPLPSWQGPRGRIAGITGHQALRFPMLFQFLVLYVYLVLSFIPSLFYMYLDILHLSWFPTGRTDATMLLRFSCYRYLPVIYVGFR